MSDGYPISGSDTPDGDDAPHDQRGASGAGSAPPFEPSRSAASRPPFPWERLFYALGFGIVAWCVFWVVIVLALTQFVLLLLQSITANVTGHPSDELKRFSLRMIQYLLELLGYIAFVRETLPFPFSPFPGVPLTKP